MSPISQSHTAHRDTAHLLPFLLFVGCGGGAVSTSAEPEGLPSVPSRSPAELVDEGTASITDVTRPGYGVLRLRTFADRTYALEVKRTLERDSARRLSAYNRDGTPIFQYHAVGDEQLSDFTVHPSGEVTIALEHEDLERDAYELVRLDRAGRVLVRAPLTAPTIPESDRGKDLEPQPFRMKSNGFHALSDGWLRVEARGEDVAIAFLSLVYPEPSRRLVSGAMLLRLRDGGLVPEWTRVVDGLHSIQPPLWLYDDFRWRESPLRPLLAVAEDGSVIVGRTFTQSRCRAIQATFGEFTRLFCDGPDVGQNGDARIQPFAFTTFDARGTRLGTRAFHPISAAEYAFFDMTVRGDRIALVGTAAPADAEGNPELYAASEGATPIMMPFDGYVSVLDRHSGALAFERYVDRGRGDSFASVRWVDEGLVAVGATDWDRWQGGMSVSRGGDPLIAFVSATGEVRSRHVAIAGESRHHLLLAVDVREGEIMAGGLGDAPLTHSADGGDLSLMTFGGLFVSLR